MGNVIDIADNPVAKLTQKVKEKDEEIAKLTQQLIDTKNKMATMVSVNEMLKMSLHDLQSTLILYRDQISGMIGNVGNLYQKLPTIDTRIYAKIPDDKP